MFHLGVCVCLGFWFGAHWHLLLSPYTRFHGHSTSYVSALVPQPVSKRTDSIARTMEVMTLSPCSSPKPILWSIHESFYMQLRNFKHSNDLSPNSEQEFTIWSYKVPHLNQIYHIITSFPFSLVKPRQLPLMRNKCAILVQTKRTPCKRYSANAKHLQPQMCLITSQQSHFLV